MNVTLLSNRYRYPDYEASVDTLASKSFTNCVELGVGGKTGTLRIGASSSDVSQFNYLSFDLGGKLYYAWITEWKKFNSTQYEVSYQIDAFRTYQNDITYGNQWIKRDMTESFYRDNMLQSTNPHMSQNTTILNYPDPDTRYLAIQWSKNPYKVAHPIQPSPFGLYFMPYNVHTGSSDVTELMTWLASVPGRPRNLGGIYSVPYVDTSLLVGNSLLNADFIAPDNAVGEIAQSFPTLYHMPETLTAQAMRGAFRRSLVIPNGFADDIFRMEHSVTLMIPDGGIIEIPDSMLGGGKNLTLTQSSDPYSGITSYTLDLDGKPTNQVVRGTALSAIPSISDEAAAYYSINSAAITAEAMNNAGSLLATTSTALGVAGPIGAVSAAIGGFGAFKDAAEQHRINAEKAKTTPPTMSGSALILNHSNRVWMVENRAYPKNPMQLYARFGYPQDYVKPCHIGQRYVQTKECCVHTDGTVPSWAIDEINRIMDNGLRRPDMTFTPPTP